MIRQSGDYHISLNSPNVPAKIVAATSALQIDTVRRTYVEHHRSNPVGTGEYAKIPMALASESIFKVDIINSRFGRFQLVEQPVKTPWLKDYGPLEHP
ncbi:MAG: hypothetical protein CL879_00270 [Dehalococcoidia bacterium]|nr:hypothetical protein [Dehalococcoidia bacterium]